MEKDNLLNRRQFLEKSSMGLGLAALGTLSGLPDLMAGGVENKGVLGKPHFPARAKRVIFMFQSGGPSQLDLFDYKPTLIKQHGKELPDSVRQGQRLTGMSGDQSSLPLVGTPYSFKQHGNSGNMMSELLPYTSTVADELCIVKSMYTEAINHDPAITFFQTGTQIAGRPSIGSWLHYGLGSDNENLPSFIVLVSKNASGQPLYARLWGNGFLPSKHQGVQFRSGKDPVLFLNNPEGMDIKDRSMMIEYLRELNNLALQKTHDPDIESRIRQYEMAYRMQTSVPEVLDMKEEPSYIYDMYGEDSRDPGTYAANCLLARRLAERDVKFIQLYHQGWDQHGFLPGGLKRQCKATDQATAALIKDLKQRGMLDDTLVIWGGEFGRTNYSQGKLTPDGFGRDHHPRCFTMWMAGGGVKSGFTYGNTDDFGYNITSNPVHVHDFQATIMHLLGIDHERLTFKHQGRRYRLTDISGKVVSDLMA